MDAVRADHHIGFGDGAVREAHARALLVLVEADRAVAGVHHPGREVRREQLDKVGAVHAEAGIPAGGVGDLDRRDRRAIVAKVRRARTDACAIALYCGLEADAPPEPPRDVLAKAVAAYRAKLDDADDRALLLEAFAAQSAIEWPALEELIGAPAR